MRALIQRVSSASVSIGGETVAAIGPGLLILVAVTHDDTEAEADWLARKVVGLRVFEDRAGKMNAGLLDVGGAALVVSQFTLYADTRKGRRPSFVAAARPEIAAPLVEYFAAAIARSGVEVQTGVFGAYMQVEIHNDGPVTIMLERTR